MEVVPAIEDLRQWADRLEEVQERLAPYFERAEPRQRASHAGRDATSAQHGALGCGPSARRPARVRLDASGRAGSGAGGR